MSVLDNIEPKRALFYFEEISKIPHGSTNTKAISDYCVNFAKAKGLKYIQDESNNLVIFKDAAAGYENSETVIIQGHLDMVSEQDNGRNFNSEKDPLELFVSDGMLGARGTTLGADDGVAVAFMLALLEDKNIKAPRLECVFTVDEEIGMLGASAFDYSVLTGRRMINLDHGEEGNILAGCAGGVTALGTIPVKREACSGAKLELEISGATGGHSGEEIDKQRANTNMLMGRVLFALSRIADIRLVSVEGGLKDNAIPRKSVARFVAPDDKVEILMNTASSLAATIKAEYEATDPKLTISLLSAEEKSDELPMDSESAKRVINTVYNSPSGIQKMSCYLPGLVQSSLNMGVLECGAGEVRNTYCVRSSIESEKLEICNRLKSLFELSGGKVSFSGDYPAWEYSKDSLLSNTVSDIYFEMMGSRPVIGTIHAGLECGIFAKELGELDCVSIGPFMYEIHTTRERLDLASTKRTWDLLLRILERLQ